MTRNMKKEEENMFKVYPDGQVVRAILRAFPTGGGGLKGIDLGCGAGRHAKLLLDQNFWVKAIDIVEENIEDTKKVLKNYDTNQYHLECIDFNQMDDSTGYDVAIAWNFLYAYNESLDTCAKRIQKIYELLKPNGKIILSLRSTDDTFHTMYEKDKNGLINNTLYDAPGCVFYSQHGVADLMNQCNFEIDYLEKFSRNHNRNWKNIKGNNEWEKADLELYEDWWAICATRKG